MSLSASRSWLVGYLQTHFAAIAPVLYEGKDFDPMKGYGSFTAEKIAGQAAHEGAGCGYITVSLDDISERVLESGDGRYEVNCRAQVRIVEPPDYGGSVYSARRDQLRDALYGVYHEDSPSTWWIEDASVKRRRTSSALGPLDRMQWTAYGLHHPLLRTEIRSQKGVV